MQMMDILSSTASAGPPTPPPGISESGAVPGADFAAALQQVIGSQAPPHPEVMPVGQPPATSAPLILERSASAPPLSAPDLALPQDSPPGPAAQTTAPLAGEPSGLADPVDEMPEGDPAELLVPVDSVDAGEMVEVAAHEAEAPSDPAREGAGQPPIFDSQPLPSDNPKPDPPKGPQLDEPQAATPRLGPVGEEGRREDGFEAHRIARETPVPPEGARPTPPVSPGVKSVTAAEQPSQLTGAVPAADPAVPAPQPLAPAAASAPSTQPLPDEHQPRLNLHEPLGERLGVVIARRLGEGGEEVQIRMDPAELGRIHVRLSFDEGGSLRAVVSADSPQVLESIRRDSAELGRTLADAGVRTDSQSFRFDRGGSSGGGGDLPRQWTQQSQDRSGSGSTEPESPPEYRPLRRSSRLDLMA